MHRSGTSLVAKILEKAGIFMGVIKDHNYEAMHFLSLNQQCMWSAGGSWLEPVVPDPIHWKSLPASVLYDEHFKLSTSWQRFYYRVPYRNWGWKDPRNTFTLPMWMDMFPNAKVIHVLRDKDSVARSLQNRNKGKAEVFDERLNDLSFNRKLADRYVEQGRSYQNQLKSRYLEVQYEDLTHLDKKAISMLEDFTSVKLEDLFTKYIRS